jgi:hypothetical protein
MYLLYADESGTIHDKNQQYFVLAGLCVFERQGYWIANELDKIVARFNPADPLFLDSKASRLIQLADLLAYTIFRYFEKSDQRFYPIIERRFDAEGGIIHGLYLHR